MMTKDTAAVALITPLLDVLQTAKDQPALERISALVGVLCIEIEYSHDPAAHLECALGEIKQGVRDLLDAARVRERMGLPKVERWTRAS
jgi:hypothetical protein